MRNRAHPRITARRWLAPTVVWLALGGGAAWGAEMAPGFKPPAVKIPEPYINQTCLENCHGLPGFAAGGEHGTLRNLFVDQVEYALSTHGQKGLECLDCHYGADPNFHPRDGYPRPDCRACHALEPPRLVFPPDVLERIAEKGIKPPPDEALKSAGYLQTVHGKAWAAGNLAAPFCAHCHTAHAVRKSSDPQSTVHRQQLPGTCGSCHEDQVRASGVGGVLARFRIAGHGKGDLGTRYDVSECLSCHPAEGAHGEEAKPGLACPTCHRVPEPPREEGFATLHVKPTGDAQPVTRALGIAYGAGFWGVVGIVAMGALVLGFAALYRKPDEG